MRDPEPKGTPNVRLSHLSFSRTSLALGLYWDWTTGIATLEAEDRGAKEGRGWPGMDLREGEGRLRVKPGPHFPQSHRALCLICDTLQLTQSFLSLGCCQTHPPPGSLLGFSQAHLPLTLLGSHGLPWLAGTLGCYLLEGRVGLWLVS